MELSIIVPVYRSEACLPELARRVRDALSPHVRDFELILVNDASPDGSWRVVSALTEAFPFVVGVNLRKNVGQDNAIMRHRLWIDAAAEAHEPNRDRIEGRKPQLRLTREIREAARRDQIDASDDVGDRVGADEEAGAVPLDRKENQEDGHHGGLRDDAVSRRHLSAKARHRGSSCRARF